MHVKLYNYRNVLYSVIYRPLNSPSVCNPLIEESIGRAIDTNITEIIITGDFNLNRLNANHLNKENYLCLQFSLFQCINEPTHYTEQSASIIDLLLVSNKHSVPETGVGEPCLDNHVCYHCPVFGVFNFIKPKHKSFNRTIWLYDVGNYDDFRLELTNFDWNALKMGI